ncbi:protein YIF1B-A-like isoform X2 [Varroa jacobsoni]|nr:protein YIF1B-A-like isoform X2 [Varroa jacobsoni]XP_022695138.1 protein YIF1B-A-like isoform X2 [Varroa jacobsoni]XP_022695139.1 protein YIF1B-A-like isoform X2 [Varroa jacobsoni]
MQPSPVLGPSQAPRLFEDTSTYGNQPPVSTPYASAPHAAPSGLPSASSQQEGGWQSYDMEMMAEYTPTQQSLPPYDPFGQPQQHGFNNNPAMPTGINMQNPYGGPNIAGGPLSTGAQMGQSGPQQQQQIFNPQQFLNDPMTSMAFHYGNAIAGHSREIVNEKIEKYVSISKLKYYFAVDTSYVSQKLFLLLFPFIHKDWAPKYNQDVPVPPRYDVNAPDLYIPTMAFVSYILLSAYMMGLEDRFSPEVLGVQASSSIAAMTVETVIIMAALYVMNINTYLKFYDLIAFCGYKFVAMLVVLLTSLLAGMTGYLLAVAYCSATLGFFLLRTLRIAFLSNPGTGHFGEGSRRSLYVLLAVCLFQPFVIWYMTHSLLLATAKGSASRATAGS